MNSQKSKQNRASRNKVIKYPGSVCIEVEKMGRRVVGVINRTEMSLEDESYPFKYYADIYLDDVQILLIYECVCGLTKLKSIVRSAMYALAMKATHGLRYRQNRAAKKGGEA